MLFLDLSKRFRYCEYLGKYFCTSCHQNKLAVIPAKVLSKWDFKKYLFCYFLRSSAFSSINLVFHYFFV